MLVQRRFGRHGLHGRRGRAAPRRGPGGEGREDHLRCGWLEAERGVWTDGVVMPPPTFDHDLGLPKRVEALAVAQLVPKPGVEALHVAVFPRAARRDVGRLGRSEEHTSEL